MDVNTRTHRTPYASLHLSELLEPLFSFRVKSWKKKKRARRAHTEMIAPPPSTSPNFGPKVRSVIRIRLDKLRRSCRCDGQRQDVHWCSKGTVRPRSRSAMIAHLGLTAFSYFERSRLYYCTVQSTHRHVMIALMCIVGRC
jgi:hypothetical protein